MHFHTSGLTYLEPALPLLLLLAALGVIRDWRRSATGRRPWVQAIAVAGIWLLSLEATAWLVSRPLELAYGRSALPAGDAEAIVVLSGSVNAAVPHRPYAVATADTYRRVRHAAWLFHNWKPVPILVCGGGRDDKPYAETMQQMLEREGVPREAIWVEPQSGNTYQSAVFGSAILRSRGIGTVALVIEANAMHRAAGAFRRQNIGVVPAPSRYIGLSWHLQDFVPGWRGIALNGENLHEIAGIAWYKLRGWI